MVSKNDLEEHITIQFVHLGMIIAPCKLDVEIRSRVINPRTIKVQKFIDRSINDDKIIRKTVSDMGKELEEKAIQEGARVFVAGSFVFRWNKDVINIVSEDQRILELEGDIGL